MFARLNFRAFKALREMRKDNYVLRENVYVYSRLQWRIQLFKKEGGAYVKFSN